VIKLWVLVWLKDGFIPHTTVIINYFLDGRFVSLWITVFILNAWTPHVYCTASRAISVVHLTQQWTCIASRQLQCPANNCSPVLPNTPGSKPPQPALYTQSEPSTNFWIPFYHSMGFKTVWLHSGTSQSYWKLLALTWVLQMDTHQVDITWSWVWEAVGDDDGWTDRLEALGWCHSWAYMQQYLFLTKL
jgi:hypothetical protein